MKRKRIVFVMIALLLLIIIAGSFVLLRAKPLSAVLGNFPESIVSVSIMTSTTTHAPLRTYSTYDRTQIDQMENLMSSVQVRFSGLSQGLVYYPGDTKLYEIDVTRSQVNESIYVTTIGDVYFSNRIYKINSDQITSFITQLDKFCSEWDLAYSSNS